MTTFENASLAQIAIFRFGKWVASRKEAKSNVGTRAYTLFQTTIRLVLHLAGFSSLTYAGFVWSTIAGFVVAGISCFILSTLVTSNSAPNPRPTVDPMANRR